MASIIFYTKIGCITSTKQVEFLRQSGHEVELRDLLAYPWQSAELLAYLGELPVAEWFNPHAPRVTSGAVDPAACDADTALKLLLEDHLLIRRPLMESGGRRMCGFDPDRVNDLVGLVSPGEARSRAVEFQQCSQSAAPGHTPRCP